MCVKFKVLSMQIVFRWLLRLLSRQIKTLTVCANNLHRRTFKLCKIQHHKFANNKHLNKSDSFRKQVHFTDNIYAISKGVLEGRKKCRISRNENLCKCCAEGLAFS